MGQWHGGADARRQASAPEWRSRGAQFPVVLHRVHMCKACPVLVPRIFWLMVSSSSVRVLSGGVAVFSLWLPVLSLSAPACCSFYADRAPVRPLVWGAIAPPGPIGVVTHRRMDSITNDWR